VESDTYLGLTGHSSGAPMLSVVKKGIQYFSDVMNDNMFNNFT